MAVLDTSMEDSSSRSKKNAPKANKKALGTQALLLTQDLSYARNLAANDEKVRKKSLKYLKKYLEQRCKATAISEDSLKILWKGLFYSMWMSDKPQVQEECAENISHLIHSLEFNEAMHFFKIGLITLQNEWVGIDQLRLDKFLMLVRRLLRQALFVLKKGNFKKSANEAFAKVLEETLLNTTKTPSLGLVMHFIDIYLEELAKVSDGKLQKTRTIDLLRPFIYKLAFSDDARITQWIIKHIFMHLMRQHKLGLEYEEKYKIWKAHGFEGSINQIQKVIIKNSEEDQNDKSDTRKPLDPRAGHINVELPPIAFDSKEISEALLVPKSDSRTTSKTRNHLTIWSEKFMSLYNGVYPLGVKRLESRKRKNSDTDTRIDKAAKRLMKFEEGLLKRDAQEKKRKVEVEEELVPKLPKKKKSNLANKNAKSEMSKKKEPEVKKDAPKNLEKIEDGVDVPETFKDEYNFCFERNSGVWFVTPGFNAKLDVPKKIKADDVKTVKKTKNNLKKTENGKMDDGEFEIFVPSKKFVKKLKKTKSGEEVEEVLGHLRGKNRTSLNHLKTPPSQPPNDRSWVTLSDTITTPTRHSLSAKKVVINTKLNVAQDIDDHLKQVTESPEIPFDGNKKPGRPVLKTPVKPSPINPFYMLKHF